MGCTVTKTLSITDITDGGRCEGVEGVNGDDGLNLHEKRRVRNIE